MSQVEIRQASAADEANILDLLERFYPGVPDHWRKLFLPRQWNITDDFLGYVIADSNKIYGFLGTIFSDYNGKRICNLTTWYVDPSHRQYTLPLFSKVMRIPNVSWTNLTPAPATLDFLFKAGFKTFQNAQSIFLPIPKLLRRNKHIEIIINLNEKDLNDENQRIYQYHKNLCCKHVVIKQDGKECYCIAVVTRFKKIPLAKIYYFSDPSLLSKVIEDIRFELCRKLKVLYLVVEGDILKGTNMLGATVKKLAAPRLYKSNSLAEQDFSLLFSELFILGI